jgi:hypothetical protein
MVGVVHLAAATLVIMLAALAAAEPALARAVRSDPSVTTTEPQAIQSIRPIPVPSPREPARAALCAKMDQLAQVLTEPF